MIDVRLICQKPEIFMLPQGIKDFLCKQFKRIVVPRPPSGKRGKLVRGRSFLNLKGGAREL